MLPSNESVVGDDRPHWCHHPQFAAMSQTNLVPAGYARHEAHVQSVALMASQLLTAASDVPARAADATGQSSDPNELERKRQWRLLESSNPSVFEYF